MTFSKFLCYADHIYLKFYQENCYVFNFLARAGEKPWWSDFEYGISATTEKKLYLYVIHFRLFTGKFHLIGHSLINNDKKLR